MRFQKKVTRTVKVSVFLLIIMASCLGLQQYVLRNVDHNSLRVEGFYQETPGSLDAVFIGASDMYTSFIPGRAYEKYGFTSYLLASESITSDGVLTAVKEVVRTQNPQLVVVEANAFLYSDTKNDQNQAYIHKFFDNLPFSLNKLDYIQKNVPVDDRWEYIFPLIKYHGLWTEYPERFYMMASDLTLDMRGYNYLKGFRTTAQVFKSKTPSLNEQIYTEHDTLPLDPKLETQLRELMDYAKQNDVNLVFVRAPHYVTKSTYDRVKRSNQIAHIVNEEGFSYYTFESDARDIGIDDQHDFYNEEHMNVYGALKFTDYVAERFVNVEDLKPGFLTDEQKESWKEVSKTSNQLYRYCDDMMTKGDGRGAQEDVVTLFMLDNYSDAPIERK